MRNVEAIGTGCAFIDYDNDGWQDILLVADKRADSSATSRASDSKMLAGRPESHPLRET